MFTSVYFVSELFSKLCYIRLREIIHIRCVCKMWRDAYDMTPKVWSILHYEDILYNKKYLEVYNVIHLIRGTPFSKYLLKINLSPKDIEVLCFTLKQFELLCLSIPTCTYSIVVNVFDFVDLDVLIHREIQIRKLLLYPIPLSPQKGLYLRTTLDSINIHEQLLCLILRGLRKIYTSMYQEKKLFTYEDKLRGRVDYIDNPFIHYRNLKPMVDIGIRKIKYVIIDINSGVNSNNVNYILDHNIEIDTLCFWNFPNNPIMFRKNNARSIVFHRYDSEMIKIVLKLSVRVSDISIFFDDADSSFVNTLVSTCTNLTRLHLFNAKDEWLDKLSSKFSSTLRILRIEGLSYLSSKTIRYISRFKNLELINIYNVKYSTPFIVKRIRDLCSNCTQLHDFHIDQLSYECKNIVRSKLKYLWKDVE